jgi:hypothetical protein
MQPNPNAEEEEEAKRRQNEEQTLPILVNEKVS